MKLEPCKEPHQFRWMESIRRTKTQDYGLTEYILTDRFYCVICLDIREKTQSAIKTEDSNDMPGWF